VLSFIDVPNILTILAAWGLELRVVVSERGCQYRATGESKEPWLYSLSFHWQLLRKLLYSRADSVTALNADTARWIERECGTAVKVIPNGIRELPNLEIERESLVLGVGRLKAEKGFDLLLRAFATVLPQFPEWRLVIVGDGRDKAKLMDLRKHLDLSGSVEFLGLVSDVEVWMARAGLVVAPSRSEAFGNVILESMAMGAPVLSTACFGPVSIIDDGVNGMLVSIDDAAALATAMAELMSKPSLRRRLGDEATKVRERFRQDKVMEMWERCLVPGDERPQEEKGL
jgi:glycosyltransferase involved in cell wall biosynthesis